MEEGGERGRGGKGGWRKGRKEGWRGRGEGRGDGGKEGRGEGGGGGGRGGRKAKEVENKERGTFFRPLMLCLHNNFNTERLPIQKCCLHVACQRKNDNSCRTASLCLLDAVFLHLKLSDG